MVHAVNLCEVYYDLVRAENENTARAAVEDLERQGLLVRHDIDREFWQEVGWYKGILARISLADCFAIVLTRRVDARLATTDHREFDSIAEKKICPVEFIR